MAAAWPSGCRDQPLDAAPCGGPSTPIHALQGDGARSPHVGERHVVEAVVTARFPGPEGLLGFFLQTAPGEEDADPRTSEGLFVYEGVRPLALEAGDRVRLSGEVREYETGGASLTELVDPRDLHRCASGVRVPSLGIALDPERPIDWEALEGMQVALEGVVTDTRDWVRFGAVGLAHARLFAPTQVVAPGAAARDRYRRDENTRVVLDDGSTRTRPPRVGTRRAGDRIEVRRGIVDHRFGAHRIQPAQPPVRLEASPRPESPPAVGGSIRVAAFNVRNAFHTLDVGDARCGPERLRRCRGARTPEARALQRARLGATLRGLATDVVALAEVENGRPEALEALRDELGPAYRAVETGDLGLDVIRVALLYRADRLQTVGAHAVLDASVDPEFDERRHRPALAQTFEELASGFRFTVVANHWKSKGGSACPGDADRGDGQGRCNGARTAAARALLRWLAADPTDSGDPDVLVLGDLNAYRLEDPLQILSAAGYEDLLGRFAGPHSYTTSFDGRFGSLDHALASPGLAARVSGAGVWHINADEPRDQAPRDVSPYGSSDHDPVLVGLAPASPASAIEGREEAAGGRRLLGAR